MNVLMINGSPKPNGNTAIALREMEQIFVQEGIQVETVHVGNKDIRGCIGCNKCMEATPVYYASANATLVAFLTRLFYSTHFDKTMKVGAAVAAARRGGLTATYDELNKFFGISGMPIASGQYWNGIHGREPGEAAQDAEGLQGMRTLARNMVFLMKSIQLGKETYGIPEREPFQRTNFIR